MILWTILVELIFIDSLPQELGGCCDTLLTCLVAVLLFRDGLRRNVPLFFLFFAAKGLGLVSSDAFLPPSFGFSLSSGRFLGSDTVSFSIKAFGLSSRFLGNADDTVSFSFSVKAFGLGSCFLGSDTFVSDALLLKSVDLMSSSWSRRLSRRTGHCSSIDVIAILCHESTIVYKSELEGGISARLTIFFEVLHVLGRNQGLHRLNCLDTLVGDVLEPHTSILLIIGPDGIYVLCCGEDVE
mmetsp:Transcript_28871/g.83776  ORF Transcript_28871/g.83776 Transcript_28871/m.83776 type:complete len:240 (+) Transcript_28871:1380-2099(+)